MGVTAERSARLLGLKDVLVRTSLARSTLYRHLAAGTFPRPVRLGAHRVAWVEADVAGWIAERVAERDTSAIDA